MIIRIKPIRKAMIVGWLAVFSLVYGGSTKLNAQEQRHLRDLNSHFPFEVPASLEQWELRKSHLKQHVLVSLGLHPMPARCDLNATIHGKIIKDGYSIEKVYFESLSDFFLCGNLYRPTGLKEGEKVPGVLCPHGHFSSGRFLEYDDKHIDDQIAKGAEQYRSNAKSVLQARCANLARMGAVVFHYDMIGYGDTTQISYELAHRFAKQRPQLSSHEGWGFFSPQAELNLQSIMGWQTWNSIRALDFLETVPEVDTKRIGVTGASGGGTQTFMLCAIDDRPAAAFPAVMVSTAMQGGCTCENCCYLRIGTGNVELAAMFAPKPMGFTAANDWTKEMQLDGFPQLKKVYELYGQPENVHLTARTEFNHNFNQVGREAMYRWFKKHLGLRGEPVEKEIEFVPPAELSVFDEHHPRPSQFDEEMESITLKLLATRDQESLTNRSTTDIDGTTRRKWDDSIGMFVEVIRRAAESEIDQFKLEGKASDQFVIEYHGQSKENRRGRIVLVQGRKDKDEQLIETRNSLVEAGFEVVTFTDLTVDKSLSEAPKVANPRESLAYTNGYNCPPLVVRSVRWMRQFEALVESKPIDFVIGVGGSASFEIAINSKSLSRLDGLQGIVISDIPSWSSIEDIRSLDLVPGAMKYGDIDGLLELALPKAVLILNSWRPTEDAKELLRIQPKPEGRSNVYFEKGGRQKVILDWLAKFE